MTTETLNPQAVDSSVSEPQAPSIEPDNGKSKKPAKIKYPGLFNENGSRKRDEQTGKALYLHEWPSDHDGSKHGPLFKSYFADERVYVQKQIDVCRERLKGYEDELEMLNKYGSAEERKKASRAKAMFDNLYSLVDSLKAAGQDPASLGIDLSKLTG